MLNDRIIPEIMEAYETIIKKLKELEAVKKPTEEQKMELEVLRYQKKILKDALELEREQFNRELKADAESKANNREKEQQEDNQ